MTINELTAGLLAVAAFSLGVRQIILSPRHATFPCAPESVRLAMFLAAAILGGLAVVFGSKGDAPYAGEAANAVALLAGLLVLYNVAMLANLLAQRYPAEIWGRIHRAHSVVRKSARPARHPAS